MMKHIISIGLIGVVSLTSSCAPRAVYVEPIGAFATQADKLGVSVTAELGHFQTDRRAQYLRQDLYQIVRAQLTSADKRSHFREPVLYLCKPRSLAKGYLNNSNYLSAVTASLKDVSAEPEKKTGNLLKALLHNYDIKIPPQSSDSEDTQCRDDFNNYVNTVYPPNQTEFLGAVAGAQALWKVFDTLANAVLQNVDDARRAAALHDYFADAANIKALKATIDANGTFLTAAAEQRRFLDLRNVKRSYAILKRAMDGVSTGTLASCRAAKAALPQGPLGSDPGFQACFDDAWDSLQDPMTKFLAVAAAYDQDANQKPKAAADDLNKTIVKLTDLATNTNVSKDTIAAIISSLVNAAANLSTLADKASSDDTQKAVASALAKF